MSENMANDWQFAGKKRTPPAGPSIRTMADLLFLPDVERKLMNWLLRQQQVSLTEVAAYTTQDPDEAQITLNQLVDQGFIQPVNQGEGLLYQPRLVHRKGRQVSDQIWHALDS